MLPPLLRSRGRRGEGNRPTSLAHSLPSHLGLSRNAGFFLSASAERPSSFNELMILSMNVEKNSTKSYAQLVHLNAADGALPGCKNTQ